MRTVLAALLTSMALVSQTAPPPAAADPVIRVSVDLVQVDAIVTDLTGRHIPDLRSGDFEILEDGKPQRITHFSYVQLATPSSSAGPRAIRASAPHAEVSLAPARMPKRDEIRRTIVLMADNLGLSAASIPRVKAAMKNFVDGQMKSGDLISILTSGGGMGSLQQFTNDKRQLYAAIDHIHWSTGRSGLSAFAPIEDGDPSIARAMAGIHAEMARLQASSNQALALETLSGLDFAVQGLSGQPGRKAIVLISEGFMLTPRIQSVVDTANRSGVVLYTIDVRGLTVTSLTAADDVHPSRTNPVNHLIYRENERTRAYRDSQPPLDRLARGTGGLFFHDDNDLDRAFDKIGGDMGDYYLIGYQPGRSDYSPEFHSIQVRVKRAGLQVRSRSGFYGAPEIPIPVMPDSRTEVLRKTLYSPFQGDVSVRLRAAYSASASDEKTGKRGAELQATLLIDAHGLKFEDQRDGRKKAIVDIVGAAFSGDNKMIANHDQTFTVSLTPKDWQETLASGLVYGMRVAIPKPGAYQFRVALYDTASGSTGSASTFVEIPDFSASRLTLASLSLERNGESFKFECPVYGAKMDAAGKMRLEFEVRLFRGPERIFSGRKLSMPAQDHDGQTVIGGEMKLPEDLPPGDYGMELIAYDRLAPEKSQVASQWTDFSIPR